MCNVHTVHQENNDLNTLRQWRNYILTELLDLDSLQRSPLLEKSTIIFIIIKKFHNDRFIRGKNSNYT